MICLSCEKEINLDLDDQSGKVVIEGNITDQPGPYFVKLSKSVSFTSPNFYPGIDNAKVSISDNIGVTEILTNTGNGIYRTYSLIGESGKTYTLHVETEGKLYTAQSTMPYAVAFEGLEQDFFMVGGKKSYTLLPIFNDPPSLGDRYLFSFKVNNNPKSIFQVFSDNINNGMPNQRPLIMPNDDRNSNDIKVVQGDSVHVEMQCIDQSIYTYYSALLKLSGGGISGGVTPSNPPGNITSGALGYFSAHTIRKRSVVIQ